MLNKSDEEKKKNIRLLDCVKLFTVEEQLGEDDPWCVCVVLIIVLKCLLYTVYPTCMHMYVHAVDV